MREAEAHGFGSVAGKAHMKTVIATEEAEIKAADQVRDRALKQSNKAVAAAIAKEKTIASAAKVELGNARNVGKQEAKQHKQQLKAAHKAAKLALKTAADHWAMGHHVGPTDKFIKAVDAANHRDAARRKRYRKAKPTLDVDKAALKAALKHEHQDMAAMQQASMNVAADQAKLATDMAQTVGIAMSAPATTAVSPVPASTTAEP